MARSGVERAASPFHVEPAGGRLYIPTDKFETVSVGNFHLTNQDKGGILRLDMVELRCPDDFPICPFDKEVRER